MAKNKVEENLDHLVMKFSDEAVEKAGEALEKGSGGVFEAVEPSEMDSEALKQSYIIRKIGSLRSSSSPEQRIINELEAG